MQKKWFRGVKNNVRIKISLICQSLFNFCKKSFKINGLPSGNFVTPLKFKGPTNEMFEKLLTLKGDVQKSFEPPYNKQKLPSSRFTLEVGFQNLLISMI